MAGAGLERSKKYVLERILRPSGAGKQALVRVEKRHLPVPTGLGALQHFKNLLPAGADAELAEYCQYALLGVSAGLRERNLSPQDEAHLEIIPPLLKDIRLVYRRLKKMKAEYDPEEFRYQAYDYGIHKVYYLDWRLYLSKTLY